MRTQQTLGFLLASLCLAPACGVGTEPGHYFEVTTTGARNRCTEADPTEYSETFTYRLEFISVNDVVLYVDGIALGAGVVSGCELTYRSPLYTDVRDEDTIRWSLRGEARIALGDNASCGAGQGWTGLETIEVSSSTTDEVEVGCVYELEVGGRYLEEVE